MPEISIAPEDPRQPDVRRLIALSDAYMAALYPAESNHLVDAEALAASGSVFLVARRDGEALGSIAFRIIEPDHAEMKRLFVCAEARGGGLGRRLLAALEDAARRLTLAASASRRVSARRKRSGFIVPPATRSARRSEATQPIRSACS